MMQGTATSLPRLLESAREEQYGNRRREAGSIRRPDDMGISERVAEQALEEDTGRRQGGPNQRSTEDPGQP